MYRLLSILLLGAFSFTSFGQNGEIQGKVVDENGGPMEFVNVEVYKNEILETGTITDNKGFFSIPALASGKYDVVAIFFGKEIKVTGVIVSSGRITFMEDIVLNVNEGVQIDEVVIEYQPPIIDLGNPSTGSIATDEDIKNSGIREVPKIVATTASVYLRKDNETGINIAGSRTDATQFTLDGVRVPSGLRLPANAIEQVEVLTGGVEAKYGDATGGFVNISSKGPSKNFHGGVELISSEFLDAYGYNLINFSLTGPIISKYKATDTQRTVLGFFIAGEVLLEEDANPSSVGIWQVKEDKLQEIRSTPLVPSTAGTGLLNSSEFVTADDLENVKARSHTDELGFNVFGRVDLKLSKFTNLAVGGSWSYRNRLASIYTFQLMNQDFNPRVINESYSGYVRFTQRFLKKKPVEGEEVNASILGNAFYSIQADYRKSLSETKDRWHEENYFQYGYVGQFNTIRSPFYQTGIDAVTGLTANVMGGYADNYTVFTPGGFNPLMEQYTFDVFNYFGTQTNPAEIRFNQGLINGDFGVPALNTYSMWYNSGANYTGYGINDNDQFGVKLDASVDLKNPKSETASKHAIEIGFEFQQNILRGWSVSPLGTWAAMRNLVNSHIELDRDNPIIRVNGVDYTWNDYLTDPFAPPVATTDTIYYNLKSDPAQQTYFDRKIREALGYGTTDYINVDNLRPEDLSLDYFSPDDLIQNGIVSYYGYDIYGDKLTTQPSFSSYFDETNPSEVDPTSGLALLSRPIGAFQPIYTAGYIQDRFTFKDIIFRAGVRVDRYDANRMVLKGQVLFIWYQNGI